MNILIIDDDPDDTLLFCEAVKELFPNAKCVAVNSCERIKDVVTDTDPDIIFMDGHMFPITGKDCLKILNELIDRQRTKIIVHSGSLSPHELREFKTLGIEDVLFKASSFHDLKGNILNIIVEKYHMAVAR